MNYREETQLLLAGNRDGLFRTRPRTALAFDNIQVREHRPHPHNQPELVPEGQSLGQQPGHPPTALANPTPQQLPNLLSFDDIKLHSLPISNTSQKLPGVVSLNSCLVGGKVMRER